MNPTTLTSPRSGPTPCELSPRAVEVVALVKRYGDTVALDGVSFDVARGEVFGVLGPNGAGKTTLIECIVGLRRPDDGVVLVLDRNPEFDRGLRELVAVQPQEATLLQQQTVRETLELWASFYRRPRPVPEALRLAGLEDKAGERVRRLSGGQRQRLLVAVTAIARPQVLCLDEPTAGLDPHARQGLWTTIRAARDDGTTVLLSTHSMEEAHALCHRVAIVDRGRLVALGNPDELIEHHATGQAVAFDSVPDTRPVPVAALRALPSASTVDVRHRDDGHTTFRIVTDDPDRLLRGVLGYFDESSICNVRVERGSLEDVFLALTGRPLQDHADGAEPGGDR